MTGLISQLQSGALASDNSIADLLRKTKVVSVKLNLEEAAQWVEHELSGYPATADVPDYRDIRGAIKFLDQFMGVWKPVIFEDPELEDIVSKFAVRQSIGSLEATIEKSEGGFLAYKLSGSAQTQLAKGVGIETEYQMQFPVSVGVGVLDGVRNRVLDWSLQLEKAGILGEGLSFSQEEKSIASTTDLNPIYNIQNVGILGDVKGQNKVVQKWGNYNSDELSELNEIVKQAKSYIDQNDDHVSRELAPLVEALTTKLDEDKPDSNSLRETLSTLRTVCEGAAGNVFASGLLSLVEKFL